jgi:4-amino-4-deoxy-L-arabinose transferase-like glycosyltransferase
MPLTRTTERWALIGVICGAFVLRAANAEQPIVENYVGRQVPTAMVARNLERGGSFLRPELDTGPFPNWFLVEPPVFALGAVGIRRATGLSLTASGRLLSALGIALMIWGLFGLARRREGAWVALAASAAAGLMPLTIRYGRAFQGDALMIGCLVASLRCWDEGGPGLDGRWSLAGWLLGATGLALKVISAYLLVPLAWVILVPRRGWRGVIMAGSMLVPAALWYIHAWPLLAGTSGSRASADNAAIWGQVLVPTSLLHAGIYATIGRFLLVRTLTPIGTALALWGGLQRRNGDRIWTIWGLSAAGTMLLLAAKLNHEYYWLALVPVAAVGVGRALVDLAGRGDVARAGAVLLGTGFAVMAFLGSASTWQTPPEWAPLDQAVEVVRRHVPRTSWVVAPEALLFAADRRGCRLELGGRSAARAAGEWGGSLHEADPAALVAFYRDRGARYFADVVPAEPDGHRVALHAAIRRRYRVLVDRPGVLLAELTDTEEEGRAYAAR